MKTDELRERYLSFFEGKGCVRRPSDVLVPRGDPSVLFTPAGMNQFKNQFLGIGPLEFTRATTCQKCLRTGDIDNVGNTAYHHTFFEMLGNFSFGDYFKRDAIHWAWEFLTSRAWLALEPERLTITVYLDDEEAYRIWHDEIKVPAARIRREGEQENFWPASAPSHGPDGVCGPCSEIYYHPHGGKGNVEIWNLVFTQFNRVGPPPDNLRALPKNNIDTGMGLERTAAVLQGFESNFENDVLKPLCVAAGEAVGKKYAYGIPEGRAIRRIADHVRAVTFCVHENVVPGPDRQSYVVRQLLRRALLEGFLIGRAEPFLYTLVPAVAHVMRGGYPELRQTLDRVQLVIKAEEEAFLRTLEKGLRKLEGVIEAARSAGRDVISGDDAFDLHQTHGFLIEMTENVAARNNLRVDRPKFEELMERLRGVSGSAAFVDSVMKAGPLDALRETHQGTEFLGYQTVSAPARVIALIAEGHLVDSVRAASQDTLGVVLDRTPFYGEAGGQVGDTGLLASDGVRFEVQDTQRSGPFILHLGQLTAGTLQPGLQLTATVDAERRAAIRRAHSATHMLHHALQTTLGTHATQRGSKVDADLLRFDFTQPQPIPRDQLLRIEGIVNARMADAAPITADIMSLDEARRSGAMALFGEKYPDRVRVVTMGSFSKELCGGTHLTNTGQVGLCKIISEESVAAGTRRITALTGARALQKVHDDEELLVQLAQALKAPRVEDLPQRVSALQEEVRTLKRELSKRQSQSAADLLETLVSQALEVAGVKIIAHLVEDGDADALRAQVDEVRRRISPVAVIFGSLANGKVLLIGALSRDLVERGLSAVDWIKASAQVVGGGGGGRPDLAQAGGKSPDKLPQALQTAVQWMRAKLTL